MAGGRTIKAIGNVVGMGLEANDGKPGREKGSQRINVSEGVGSINAPWR